jgi:hypothetical protein
METSLDPRKTQALYLLLAGETYAFIAKTLGVHPKTIRRWTDEPAFAEELKMETQALNTFLRTHGMAQATMNVEKGTEATRFLTHVMTADGAPLHARMRAAQQLMNSSYKFIVHSQKMDQAEQARPINGLREVNAERQAKQEMKSAYKVEAAEAAKVVTDSTPVPNVPIVPAVPAIPTDPASPELLRGAWRSNSKPPSRSAAWRGTGSTVLPVRRECNHPTIPR